MKKVALAVVAGLVLATGCDDETQTRTSTASTSERGSAQLIYSFPTQAQGNVPTSSPMFLHFSSPVTNDPLDDHLSLRPVDGDEDIPFSIRRVNEDRTLVLEPESALDPATDYQVMAEGLTYGDRTMRFPEDGVRFTTRAASGDILFDQMSASPDHTDLESGQFGILSLIPDGDNFPLTDLATLRVQFTEPLDPDTVSADSVFIEDSSGDRVAAELRFKGPNLTIDPDDDLTPGEEYTLHLSETLRSTLDAELNAGPYEQFRFVAEDANRSSPMPLRVIGHDNERRSALSGELYNSVSLSSALLGPDNATFMGPDLGPGSIDNFEPLEHVFTELGSVVRFEEKTPLRIPKGSRLTGTSVDVDVAGAQPAGLTSGTIDVRFLSDANGFMIANPYSSSRSAPKNLVLFADLALNTEDTVSNSALGQKLLNVPLIGTISLDNGALSIDALTVIEPGVLGVDTASGLVSFRLEGYERSSDGPSSPSFEESAPVIKASLPGSNADTLRPGDPLILYFDRPVDRRSVADNITLDGTSEVSVSTDVDGSVVVIRPDSPLQHGVDYTLNVSGITDVLGNEMVAWTDEFSLAPGDSSTSSQQSPLALTTTPGYPCAKDIGSNDVNADSTTQGRCSGNSDEDDDLLPIADHPRDRALSVRFSQNMDPDTFVPDNHDQASNPTVRVEKLVDGQWQAYRDWEMDVTPRKLRIQPLNGWEEGALYRYSLASSSSSGGAIQSETGQPLQTELLTSGVRDAGSRTFGGPDLVNHFRGAERETMTGIALSNLPASDTNADLTLGGNEVGVVENNGSIDVIPNSARLALTSGPDSALVEDARIGCAIEDPDCPENRFIYFSGMLDARIGTQQDPDTNAVPVYINPSILYTTGLHVEVEVSSSVSWIVGRYHQAPTGPMVMRMRYEESDESTRHGPLVGYIRDVNGQLKFELELDLYLDAPYLEFNIPMTTLDHNLRSYRLDGLKLEGPVDFLEDGRMNIRLENPEPEDLDIEVRGRVLSGTLLEAILGSPDTDLTLTIRPGDLVLNYVSGSTHR